MAAADAPNTNFTAAAVVVPGWALAQKNLSIHRSIQIPCLTLVFVLSLAQTGCKFEIHEITIHVIALTGDDGDRMATTTPEQIANHVKFMNGVYTPARIKFSFDSSTGCEWRPGTALNRMHNAGADFWVLPNSALTRYPGKIVVFLCWGGTDPVARMLNGFADPPKMGAALWMMPRC